MIKLFIDLENIFINFEPDWRDRALHDPSWLRTLPLANKRLWSIAKSYNPTLVAAVQEGYIGCTYPLAYQIRSWVDARLGVEYEFIAAIKNPIWTWCEERNFWLVSANRDLLKQWESAGGVGCLPTQAIKKLKSLWERKDYD